MTNYINPFEIASKVREENTIDNILRKSKTVTSPLEQNNLMGELLQTVSPSRRPEVMDLLKERAARNVLQGKQREVRGERPQQPYSLPENRPQSNRQSEQMSLPSERYQRTQSPIQNTENLQQPIREEKDGYDFLKGTTPALKQRAEQLVRENPYKYYDNPYAAQEDALKEYSREQENLSKFDTDFESAFSSNLGSKENAKFSDALGELKDDYKNIGRERVARGLGSPEKVARDIAKEALEFSKARANLGAVTANNLFSTKEATLRGQRNLRSIREAYKNADRLEYYKDDLVNKVGLSNNVANFLAFPVSTNKDIDRYVRDTKSKTYFSGIPLISGVKDKNKGGTQKRSERDIGNYVKDHLKDSDSLTSIATAFNAKGYSGDKIMSEFLRLNEEGKLRLNKRQQRELQQQTGFGATLKDIAFFSGSGLTPKEIVNEY